MAMTTLDPSAKRHPYGTLGQAIKHFRKKSKLSQVKLGELVGVTQAAIAHYEAGHRIPGITMIQKLSEVFHCPIQLLISHKTSIY